ncbi:MAG: hypothetical protein ACRDO0_16055 [Nocardioidaceae bacterium]
MRWWWALPAVLLGAGVGLAGLVVHRHAFWVANWPVPWGALLGVAAPTVIGLGLRRRTPLLLGYLFGWFLLVTVALATGPGGDFMLMSDVLGWGFLSASLVLMAVVLIAGARARRDADRSTERSRAQRTAA